MAMGKVRAQVISMPGQLGDVAYEALEIDVEGFSSPYVLTLALPAIGYRALSKQVNPHQLYSAVEKAINAAAIQLDVSDG